LVGWALVMVYDREVKSIWTHNLTFPLPPPTHTQIRPTPSSSPGKTSNAGSLRRSPYIQPAPPEPGGGDGRARELEWESLAVAPRVQGFIVGMERVLGRTELGVGARLA
jgi:hypothetical protein